MMIDATTLLAASFLAGIAAAALVCAAFFPLLRPVAIGTGRTLADVLGRAGRDAPPQTTTRTARRAQAIALRLVEEERRTKSMTRLSQKLDHAGLSWSAPVYAMIAVILGLLIFGAAKLFGFALGPSLSAAMLLAVVIPSRSLDVIIGRRQQRFLAGFAAAVDMIVRCARAGLSLPDCLGMVASDAAPAVRREFAPLVAQLRAGVPMASAIEKLAARMPIPEVRFFAIVLSVQSQTGGNFTDALANLAGVLRERERLAAKVRTASAEVKASAVTIGVLPFLVAGATAMLAPDHISMLWQDEAGRRVSGFCAIWLILGIAVLRRMARIEP
jgi:tight adherence protein B